MNQLNKCGGSGVEFMKKIIRQMSVVEPMKIIQSVITNIVRLVQFFITQFANMSIRLTLKRAKLKVELS